MPVQRVSAGKKIEVHAVADRLGSATNGEREVRHLIAQTSANPLEAVREAERSVLLVGQASGTSGHLQAGIT